MKLQTRIGRWCRPVRRAPCTAHVRVALWLGAAPSLVLRARIAAHAVAQGTKTSAPLSLSDIITFESQLGAPAAVQPEEKVQELISKASRVLSSAQSVLDLDLESDGGAAAPSASSDAAASARLAPGAVSSVTSTSSRPSLESGRELFGSSAEASELQASRTRQALQIALSGAESSYDKLNWRAADGNGGSSTSGGAAVAPPPSGTLSGGGSKRAALMDEAEGDDDDPASPSWARQLFNGDASGTGSSGGGGAAASSGEPQLQRAAAAAVQQLDWAPLAFAEADLSVPTMLYLKSEESLFAERARAAVLPPLASVLELTSAARPPQQGGAAQVEQEVEQETALLEDSLSVSDQVLQSQAALGRKLQDGVGRLADGTRFEKLSGTDYGENGYAKRWEVLRGITGDGTVSWEECWWEASDRCGLRELGAFKKGRSVTGSAWQEEWKEVLHTHTTNHRLVIERTAHKWARDDAKDEWEEKWGERFEEVGRVHKFADKWAKQGPNVWHERWGEDYDGHGACQKYTDKWAERLLPNGANEQWGDKWTETFGDGKGTKHGEVWSSDGGGNRYNRWWNEEHYGDGRVRKWGNSTGGEYWDAVEHMDTYYNPVPHFGFHHAVNHSPNLWAVPLPLAQEVPSDGPEDDDGLGMGLGRL